MINQLNRLTTLDDIPINNSFMIKQLDRFAALDDIPIN